MNISAKIWHPKKMCTLVHTFPILSSIAVELLQLDKKKTSGLWLAKSRMTKAASKTPKNMGMGALLWLHSDANRIPLWYDWILIPTPRIKKDTKKDQNGYFLIWVKKPGPTKRIRWIWTQKWSSNPRRWSFRSYCTRSPWRWELNFSQKMAREFVGLQGIWKKTLGSLNMPCFIGILWILW